MASRGHCMLLSLLPSAPLRGITGLRLYHPKRGLRRGARRWPAGVQEELDEALQFCDLMVVGHPEDALDRAKRAKNFYALDMGRLVVALRRYREVDHRFFGHSPQLPKVGPHTEQLPRKCATDELKLRFKGADIERVSGSIS